MLRGEDVVFVGLGKSVPSWYRCALPAFHLGCRWIGYSGDPPKGSVATGNTMMQRLSPGEARVWILQQPKGHRWLEFIRAAKRKGAKVLYEVDDLLEGVPEFMRSDGARLKVTPKRIAEYHRAMAECDGIVCSTPYLAERYSEFNRTWVCRNGIDTARFGRRRNPDRARPSLGWFGGANHEASLTDDWQEAVGWFCAENGVRFYNIGHQYEWPHVPPELIVRIPFVPIENVPDALASVDIGIAPWADDPFYRGKSDLRVLEGAAAGVTMLADPAGYGHLPPSACWFSDGYDAHHWLTTMLTTFPDGHPDLGIDEPAWRTLPRTARRWVERERDASVTAADWEAPLNALAKEM